MNVSADSVDSAEKSSPRRSIRSRRETTTPARRCKSNFDVNSERKDVLRFQSVRKEVGVGGGRRCDKGECNF